MSLEIRCNREKETMKRGDMKKTAIRVFFYFAVLAHYLLTRKNESRSSSGNKKQNLFKGLLSSYESLVAQ